MNVFALGMILPLAACSFGGDDGDRGGGAPAQGSGSARTFQVADFTEIDLRGSDDVDVRVGGGFSVRAEGPSDQLDTLKIERDGDALKIGRKSGNWGWSKSGKVRIHVTLPRLTEADVAGSGNMTIDRVEGGKFEGGIAGSGDLSIGALRVDEARFSIAGSGNAHAAGSAKSLRVEIAGSGDVDASGLQAQGAKVEIAGSGNAHAAVDGPATIDLMGSGDVDLGPKARCTTSKMGSGSVRCGG